MLLDETSLAQQDTKIHQSSWSDTALEFEEDFDPLAVDDFDIDQENMDDDNPYDTVDFPTLRNMPEQPSRAGVYTVERQGSVTAALLDMFDHNPARRPILLSIINLCRDGAHASAVSELVTELQKDNRSVYAPMTLCRMLERAGALELEMPQVSVEHEDAVENVEYLEITERIDPVWRATADAVTVYDEFARGSEFHSIVLDIDSRYAEVYASVMRATADGGCSRSSIEQLVDSFDIVHSPRRFGGHFIDILERTDAIVWKDRAWHLTDLGKRLLPEIDDLIAAQADNTTEAACKTGEEA